MNGRNELLTVIKYKPPHKLSPEHLRAGHRLMNPVMEIIQNPEVHANREERLQYVADMKVAIVATQVFEASWTGVFLYSRGRLSDSILLLGRT